MESVTLSGIHQDRFLRGRGNSFILSQAPLTHWEVAAKQSPAETSPWKQTRIPKTIIRERCVYRYIWHIYWLFCFVPTPQFFPREQIRERRKNYPFLCILVFSEVRKNSGERNNCPELGHNLPSHITSNPRSHSMQQLNIWSNSYEMAPKRQRKSHPIR